MCTLIFQLKGKMNIEDLYTYCLNKKGSEETLPFDESTVVFKVGGKMFALLPTDAEDPFINLKCDPDYAIELRDSYECITAGYHMNKKHWNSIYYTRGEIDVALVFKMIDASYDLIYTSLPKKIKAEIDALT